MDTPGNRSPYTPTQQSTVAGNRYNMQSLPYAYPLPWTGTSMQTAMPQPLPQPLPQLTPAPPPVQQAIPQPSPFPSLPTSPEEVVKYLLEGNQRFIQQESLHRTKTPWNEYEAARTQDQPFAVVICCADLLSSPEILFDCPPGTLYTLRTAGNTVGSLELGSIEAALALYNPTLVLVLGHSECGAIRLAIDSMYSSGKSSAVLRNILPSIHKARALGHIQKTTTEKAVWLNVRNSVATIRNHAPLQRLIRNKKLQLAGAMLDTYTGKVEFLPES